MRCQKLWRNNVTAVITRSKVFFNGYKVLRSCKKSDCPVVYRLCWAHLLVLGPWVWFMLSLNEDQIEILVPILGPIRSMLDPLLTLCSLCWTLLSWYNFDPFDHFFTLQGETCDVCCVFALFVMWGKRFEPPQNGPKLQLEMAQPSIFPNSANCARQNSKI